ncbi:MAG: hypothetical protein DRH23_00320 [Deltaproteobacteria bacterium]|nr:enoyl-CoA hydratase/isomerase family protein [Deltaproteobacteria bacterium]MBW2222697.1 enoyl-CoA hydratase/isomerase family protein [Deltaproteobacteria bacterium]MBW2402380.1 enoyl-CoA hydratase/isomerase family protein [Deltaproteobacteria bacterium]MBW2546117.1 enoyl-CoA hydratase/isomerase family protein [Deltaproteobacteria bacterium]MBW2717115.1 enoyl-CoA hydratase/isomerase family protein [Deltaproteobacteria bacterium]
MELSVLQYEVVDSVAVIRMSHPPVNAFGPAFLEDLEKVLTRLDRPGEARAALITSAIPGLFCVGDDVSQLREVDDSLLALHPRAVAALDAFEALPMPTIAAINGHALGGGFELALTCDFRSRNNSSWRKPITRSAQSRQVVCMDASSSSHRCRHEPATSGAYAAGRVVNRPLARVRS